MQIILHKKITNNVRSFALPITVKKSVLKDFCSAEFLFPITGKSSLYMSWFPSQSFVTLTEILCI